MRKAAFVTAVLSLSAVLAAPAIAGGGSADTELVVLDGGDNGQGEFVLVGEVRSISKCEKYREIDFVVKKPGENKVIDSDISSKRGAFSGVIRKSDFENAEDFFAKAQRSQAGGTTCKGKKQSIPL